MKKFSPQLLSSNQVISGKRKILVPPYQRSYSWEEKHWEKFLWTIRNFIESREIQEENEIFFIGQIIFSEEKDIWNIIDGQQRIVTIFLFLITFLQHYKQLESNEKLVEIEDRILRLIFNVRLRSLEKLTLTNKYITLDNSRINFSNEEDDKDYQFILQNLLSEEPLIKGKVKKISPNIQRAVNFFAEFLDTLKDDEKLNFLEVAISKLNFVEVVLGKEKDIIDLFIALNETGLNLTESDFLRSLIIRLIGGKEKGTIQKLAKEWDEKIVGFVSETKAKKGTKDRKTIAKKVNDFFVFFWKVEFGEYGRTSKHGKLVWATKFNIYELIQNKIEEDYKPEKIFQNLLSYATIYRNIKNPQEEVWNRHWPVSLFNLLNDAQVFVNFNLLTPLILRLEKSREEGKIENDQLDKISHILEKIFLLSFRDQTIRGISPTDIHRLITDLVTEIRNENFVAGTEKVEKFLVNKFTKESSENFYRELENWWAQNMQKDPIFKYIFSRYYLAKRGKIGGFKEKIDYQNIQIEHLVAKKAEFLTNQKEEVNEEWNRAINSLGNITLLMGKVNGSLSNKPWTEKKIILENLDKNCMLFLEGKNSPLYLWKKEPIIKDINERTKRLVKEFKELKIFE